MANKAGAIKIELQAHVKKFNDSLRKARQSVTGVGGDSKKAAGAVSSLGGAAAGAAKGFLALGAAVGTVSTIRDSIGTFAQFERSMTRVGSVTRTVGTRALSDMTKQAQELAATTEHTGREVADAMGFLGMAGFNANQIMGATPAVLQLASAGMMDVASAADVVTNVLSSYSMSTDDLAQANNILVSTFTNSNTSLGQLGEAFKYVGSVAQSAGFDFKEISASIGLLGNSGIQASMAGTSLRGAIARLQAPTKGMQKILKKYNLEVKKSDGSLLSMKGIIDQLNKSAIKGGDVLQLFGLRAGPAMQILMKSGAEGSSAYTFVEAKAPAQMRIAAPPARMIARAIPKMPP